MFKYNLIILLKKTRFVWLGHTNNINLKPQASIDYIGTVSLNPSVKSSSKLLKTKTMLCRSEALFKVTTKEIKNNADKLKKTG